MEKKIYSFLQQAAIFAFILLISNGIAALSPIPLPAAVVGMVLLFTALCLKIVKVDQVEGLGNSLSKIITFLFVPSGISLINSLDIMQKYGIQIVLMILMATLGLLAFTGWTSAALLRIKDRKKAKQPAVIQAQEEKNAKGSVVL